MAAVIERIGLVTDILVVPYRVNAALVAKQALTLDALSEGRLTLGVGIGGNSADYQASGVPMSERGARMDAMLGEMKAIWAGEQRGDVGPVGPPTRPDGPALLVGGSAEASFRRVAQLADGWTMGGGGPDAFARGSQAVRAAWREAGREGEPRLMALCYFALGQHARQTAERYLSNYYSFLGSYADRVARSAVDVDAARSYRDAFAA